MKQVVADATGSDGVVGQAKMGTLELAVMGAFDGSEANTTRALPGGTTATSRYDMHRWTLDTNASYAIEIGYSCSLKTEVGITHIEANRQGAVETGGSPQGLG